MSATLFVELVAFLSRAASSAFILDRMAYEQNHLGEEILWSSLLSCFSFVSVSNLLITIILLVRKRCGETDINRFTYMQIVTMAVSISSSALFCTLLVVELFDGTIDMYPSDRKTVLLSLYLIQLAYDAMLLRRAQPE